MDQIVESFGIDWKIFTAEIVNFLLVLSILYFFVFKKITDLLDKRSQKIKEGIDNALLAAERLNQAEEEKRKILRQAGEQATAEIKASVDTAKQREEQIVAQAHEKSHHMIKQAEIKGAEMKEKIVASSKEEIAKMIVLGTEKILKTQ